MSTATARPGGRGRDLLCAAVLLAVFSLPACRSGRDTDDAVAGAEAAQQEATDAEPESNLEPMRRASVRVHYPAASGFGLIAEEHEIFETASPVDRAKQILADLISGPFGSSAVRALPEGARLRQVYVLADGIAWIDFSEELRSGMGGGSAQEQLVVYSIVNSLAGNVPEIRRVGLLINGNPIDTLNGHLDLRRPLPPDPKLLLGAARAEAEPDATPTEAPPAEAAPPE
jgi:hypothetical protein